MEYFKILNLIKEPFSNSPEPEFFYDSPQHVNCLQNLEMAIRLRRGLNVIVGEVGTGKTTLCRRLINQFDGDEAIRTHLILDPSFNDSFEFLTAVCAMLGVGFKSGPFETEWMMKEAIKNYLFEQGVSKGRIVVLVIDEGQKIPDFCIEILREFLNFETNDYKLLQIVIFAQTEFNAILEKRKNFADRINVFYELGPLGFADTRALIRHRIEKASRSEKSAVRFSYPALRAIYRATGGYPRRIVTLCHQIILTMIIQNRTKVTRALVLACSRRTLREKQPAVQWAPIAVLAGILLVIAIVGITATREANVVVMDERHSYRAAGNTAHVSPDARPVPAVGTGSEQRVVESDADGGNRQERAVAVSGQAEQAVKEEMAMREAPSGDEGAVVSTALPSYPPVLGTLIVEEGWIVSRMIAGVRGFCEPDYLRQVRALNRHIGDLDRIASGDVITFPAAPTDGEPWKRRRWIEVAQAPTLVEAHRITRRYLDDSMPVCLLPHWTSKGGMVFSVIMTESFGDEASAREALHALPPEIADAGRIIETWEGGTVFFSHCTADRREGQS